MNAPTWAGYAMTPLAKGQIMETLRQCGVSPFNVIIWRDGSVVFCSNGLTLSEVERARFEVSQLLMMQRLDELHGK